MVFIRYFCVVFTIRLGSIMVGVAYLLETFVCFILSLVWVIADPSKTKEALKEILAESELLYFSDLLHRVSRDPSPFKEVALAICCVRLVCCALQIYGSYYMKPLLLLPFLAIEFVRLTLLLFLHITGMQLIKENSQDLGLLIGATLAGSFLMLFLFYTWICVYSLFLALWKLRSKVQRNTLSMQRLVRTPEFPPKLYPAYSRHSYHSSMAQHGIAPIY